MEPAAVQRGNYAGRTARRGSVSSVHREDGPNTGTGNGASGFQATSNVRQNSGADYHHNDLMKTIYVANITSSIPEDALWEAFGHFGRVESVVRRDVNMDLNNSTEQQYAFIRFRNRQEARYAIMAGELNFYGRKLIIRPRDKPSYYKSTGYSNDRTREFEGHDKIRQRQSQGYDRRFDHRGPPLEVTPTYQASSGQLHSMPHGSPVEMLSKVLTVANLPPDMSPKELYDLFASYGAVERSYIFQHADAAGRRFGEVTMASFFFAQKAIEGMNTFCIRGLALDVSYKISSPSVTPTVPEPTSPMAARNYVWPMPPIHWPYPLYGAGNGPQFQTAQSNAQYTHNSSSIVVPYTIWNAANNTANPHVNYSYPGYPIQAMPQVPLCVYPSQASPQAASGHSSQYQRGHLTGSQYSYITRPGSSEDISVNPTETGSRSISGASSTTLVSNNHEYMREKKYESPLIVNSTNYRQHGEKSVGLEEKQEPSLHASFPVQVAENHSLENACAKTTTPLPSPISQATAPAAQPVVTSAPALDPTLPPFIPETARPRDPSNLYIKNLDDTCINTTVDLKTAFEQFGPIASAYLATYPNGASKCFGFVAFVHPVDAVNARERMDGVMLGRKRLFVTFAERKEERSQRLKELFESKKRDNADEFFSSTTVSSNISKVATDTKTTLPGAEDKVTENISDGNREILAQEASEPGAHQAEGEVTVTTTVTTTKAWKGTQLHGIVEVEEEESPCSKRFRQPRTHNNIQHAAVTGSGNKDQKPLNFSNPQTPPPNGNTFGYQHNNPQLPQGRAEEYRGSPTPQNPRQRSVNNGTNQRCQSPRNIQRPFYPPRRGGPSSPKPPVRKADANVSPAQMSGVPMRPRTQENRSSHNSNREFACKGKNPKFMRRGSDGCNLVGHEQDTQHGPGKTCLDSPRGSNSASSSDNSADIARTAAQLDKLEVCSEP